MGNPTIIRLRPPGMVDIDLLILPKKAKKARNDTKASTPGAQYMRETG